MKSNLSFLIWDSYNKEFQSNPTQFVDPTKNFFKEAPEKEQKSFQESPNQIIQFGCSLGRHISTLSNRKIIGYDYSPIAIKHFSDAGHIAREIDLNTHSEGELCYLPQIKQDLASSSDILLIRILEYLDPLVITLLLYALIDNAKPGSMFYVEIQHNNGPQADQLKAIGHITEIKRGKVPSYFAPRTDIQFFTYLPKTKRKESDGTVNLERLIVGKLG